MTLDFSPSKTGPTVGIELELQAVDAVTGDLRPVVPQLLAAIQQRHPGAEQRIHRELFTNTMEVVTGVARSVSEAITDLQQSIEQAREVAHHLNLGVRFISAGTHPFASWRDQEITDDERIRGLMESIQEPVRRALTFGLHVHVGVASGDAAVSAVQLLSAYSGHLIALSAASPFWNGHDTGLASYRGMVFGLLPMTGVPPRCDDWAAYQAKYEAYLRAGWIKAHKDLHWDVRPSPGYGTVELRVCDAVPTLAEVAAIAALCQCLVVAGGQLDPEMVMLSPDVVALNKWQAQRHGLEASVMVRSDGATMPLRQSMAGMVEQLTPVAARLGCALEFAGLARLLDSGTSSARQRAVWRRSERGTEPMHTAAGMSRMVDGRLVDVVDALATELETGSPVSPRAPS